MPNEIVDTLNARVYLAVIFVLGGLFLEMLSHPKVHLSHLGRVMGFARENPAPALAVVYGIWTLVVASLSPNPLVAFTGQLNGLGDGALWTCLMVAVFVLVYLNCKEDSKQIDLLGLAVIAGGLTLVVLASLEVLLSRPFVIATYASEVPLVTFAQRGHLSGYFVLAIAVAVGYWHRNLRWTFIALFFLAFGVGMTNNRSALIVIAFLILISFMNARANIWRFAGFASLISLGIILGLGITKAKHLEPGRDISSTASLDTRAYIWKAAFRGIAKRPLLGWGGGVFQYNWPEYLSRQELEMYLHKEFGYKKVLDVRANPDKAQLLLIVEDGDGKNILVREPGFKAHNEFLEQGLMWGLMGLLLYIALLAYSIRGALRLEPVALGNVAYQAFLLFWYLMISSQAVVWVLLGGAAAALAHTPKVRFSVGDVKPFQ